MRVTITLTVAVAAAFAGSAVLSPPHQPADAASASGDRGEDGLEYRGELYPNPETGCVEIPDEPGAPVRLWPYQPSGDSDVLPPGDATDEPEIHRFGDPPEEGADRDPGIARRPWPLCEDPEVLVVVSEEAHVPSWRW